MHTVRKFRSYYIFYIIGNIKNNLEWNTYLNIKAIIS